MVYGSTPKTPTKRRFIGTSTILKTPTDAKKQRRAMDNTCRSVLTSNMTNINRTAATCLSPSGKPPRSRLRTPLSSAKKARIPISSRTPKKQEDTVSIKSAPADNSKKTTLSTTVVSSSTASSAKSAPLLEAEPAPYSDFASEINNHARQNRVVRSSAIGDKRR